MIFFSQLCYACTGFGVITNDGTIIGRNRDYYYYPQKFELIYPNQQFNNWYDNDYGHDNQFYALTSKNNVSMGVNQHGLTIIEEDSPLPANAKTNRRFQQPQNGTAEGMIKYGILQNFDTVDEIIPFLSRIFSVADPHFYQIADSKKILTVEVAYGENNADLKRKFSYRVLSKRNDYFTHTNLYLTPEFVSLNDLRSNSASSDSAKNRLQRITALILNSREINTDAAINWLMDTYSDVSSVSDRNECLNTSLFRSNLQESRSVDINKGNDKVYGTVSSMVVHNTGDLKKSTFYLAMIDSITTNNDDKQLIKYKELRTNLADLFGKQNPLFVQREFVRNPPTNGVCPGSASGITGTIQEKLAKLEAASGGKLGISAVDTANNARIQYRAQELFPIQSTFKFMLVSAILKQSITNNSLLQKKVVYTKQDLLFGSPITKNHVSDGMTISDLSGAAMMYSDDTATNLLMRQFGGPAAVTKFARSVDDNIFHVEDWLPNLNSNPDVLRDISTPAAMLNCLQKFVLEDTLPLHQRRQLLFWLNNNTTGDARIRAGVPKGWLVGDKTGTGDYGVTNDIGIIWPPNCAPIVVSIYFVQNKKDAVCREDIVAAATRLLISEFARAHLPTSSGSIPHMT